MGVRSSVSARRRRSILVRPLVIALLIRTCDHRTGLQIFLDQMRIPALGALLRNRLVRRSELALRIIAAPVEGIAFARALLDQFAVLAKRALHADEVLLHVFAVRIPAARGELAVAAMADHHIAPALRAKLFERNIWHFLALIEAPGRLAIRISCARHKLAEASALENHRAAAVLAIFFSRSRLLQIGGVKIRKIYGVLFRKCATVGIVFVVGAACVE